MDEDRLTNTAKEELSSFGSTHRVWVVPLLQSLVALGGRGRPMDVEEHIRRTSAATLNPLQWARIRRGNHIRWTRLEMKARGWVTGERGVWELTEAGRRALAELAVEQRAIPTNLPELQDDDPENVTAPLVTMPATNYDAYHIPVLSVLAERGLTPKRELIDEVGKRVVPELLPGDLGTLPQGFVLWRYRTSWALTALKKAGEIKNTTVGSWDITETGKARLAAEKDAWSLRALQRSKAKVRPPRSMDPHPRALEEQREQIPAAEWSLATWRAAMSTLGAATHRALDLRLRPDLGPTPAITHGTIPRNIIFYGPPGTGKTYLATQAAIALTGERDPEQDGSWQIVQFHPSYAYEDFIQGLRPDLEQPELRYKLTKGPFLQICERAGDDPDQFFVLVIDEINRGDPARIFGELLYGLEYRGNTVALASGGELSVPPNLIVLGTMNSVDRSVALVDYALRRRFAFVRIAPDPDVIRAVRGESAFGATAAAVLEEFNGWIAGRLGPEHVLGHSVFLNPGNALTDVSSLDLVWELDVAPLLDEYFFGEPDARAEAASAWRRSVDHAMAATREALDEDDGEAAM